MGGGSYGPGRPRSGGPAEKRKTRVPRRYLYGTSLFWSAESRRESAPGDWQRVLKGVFNEAKIPDGHARRFRDTFAVELPLAGVPMDRVLVLLGHSSIKVTEKHYSPWVRARQEQLEADVRRTWELTAHEERSTGPVI